MIPLYTKYILPDVMGEFDLIQTYINAIVPVVFLEIWSALIRYLYDFEEYKSQRDVFRSVFSIFSISLIVLTALALLGHFVFKIDYVLYMYILCISYAISYLYQFSARGLSDNEGYAISGIINTFVLSFSNYILIVHFGRGLEALIFSNALGSFAQSIFLEIRLKLLRRIVAGRNNSGLTKAMASYAAPLSLNSISFWTLKSSNKLVINEFLGTSANGIYAISQKFSNLVAFVSTAFNYAWQDIAFSREDKEDSIFYSKAIGYFSLFLSLGCGLIIIAAKIVGPLMIHDNYEQAINLIPLGVIGAGLNALSTFIGNIFGALKKTKSILSSTIISGIANILLAIYLIPRMGLQGANLSSALAFTLIVVLRLLSLRKMIGLKVNLLYLLSSSLILMVSVYIFFL